MDHILEQVNQQSPNLLMVCQLMLHRYLACTVKI